ncbi:uncharacterized protein SPAPADRAFT_67130 [Spathaspora passalidarum NRRL Y-27907]|uniref:F-box domain-containing protein n=1 Tax=Spathaspora passalidarum (strain NRRL Y-27907 / 11-Y1) TaxID=619300 RepID=G3ANJ7_SPAPN|nr:uncharacterized protein SPAPADRAFT_67130 [Spathaspora passalidarum NRRL Y-27907]EGW32526.1 hypothetical protein SPAPADRAFT_67130 [Spathaspora passalidarum NRRL Y-27907]
MQRSLRKVGQYNEMQSPMDSSPQSGKSSLLCLPVEILYEIVCYLNQCNLLQVSLINKLLRDVAFRKLYSRIYVQTSSVRQLVVGDYVNTPLHINYTLVNGREKLISLMKHTYSLRFLREILFHGDDNGIAMGLSRAMRDFLDGVNIYLCYNSMGEVYSREPYLYRNLVIIRDNQFIFDEDNYSIQSLTLLASTPNQDYNQDLSFVYRLKSLKKLSLTIQTKDTLKLLRYKLPEKLHIEQLSLNFRNLLGINVSALVTLFDLCNVTSLYIRIPQGYYKFLPTFVVPEIIHLLSQTINVRNFGLSNSAPINYMKVLRAIRKNTLNTLYLEPWYGHEFSHSPKKLLKILHEQQLTLTRIFYGKNFNAHGFEVFEEVFRVQYGQHRLERVLNKLRREVSSRKRLPCLKQIVLDQMHYFTVTTANGNMNFKSVS